MISVSRAARVPIAALAALIASFPLLAQSATPERFDGVVSGLGDLPRLSKARSRSISPENFTGEKGKGGMATEGTGKGDSNPCRRRERAVSWASRRWGPWEG